MPRPYDPDCDADALWRCKRAFEAGLGSETGDDAKAAAYAAKLTGAYRERYLAWVADCVDRCPGCVRLAEREGDVVGYAFVLPEDLAMVWDAAVLNELYVVPDCRGAGVADDLLDDALAVARGQDLPLDRILLDVDPDNERARAFYDRHGFATWGEVVARDL